MKAIVICHHPSNKEFLDRLLESLKSNYPVVVCTDGIERPEHSYEIGAIQYGKDNFDEFILLQDSCVIKDNSLLDKLFDVDGNVFITNGGYHYMGKFISKDIPQLPNVQSKEDAIEHELHWFKTMQHSSYTPDLPAHTDIFEEIYRKQRMKLENDYIIKYKGTYIL